MWLVFRTRNLTKSNRSGFFVGVLLLKRFPYGADIGCCGTGQYFWNVTFIVTFFYSKPSSNSPLPVLSLFFLLLFTIISVSLLTYFIKVIIILLTTELAYPLFAGKSPEFSPWHFRLSSLFVLYFLLSQHTVINNLVYPPSSEFGLSMTLALDIISLKFHSSSSL